MENKYKVLALFGKSGAGKDTIQKWLTTNYNMNGIISCTTRPKRDYEKDGVDYHFLSNEEFAQKCEENGIVHRNNDIFAYIHKFESNKVQISFLDKI